MRRRKRSQRVAGGPPIFLSHLFPLALFYLQWHHRYLYTVLATRDFNYFLIRSFQPGLAEPRSSLRMLNANLPPPLSVRHAAPSSATSAAFIVTIVVFFLPSFSSEDRSPERNCGSETARHIRLVARA